MFTTEDQTLPKERTGGIKGRQREAGEGDPNREKKGNSFFKLQSQDRITWSNTYRIAILVGEEETEQEKQLKK